MIQRETARRVPDVERYFEVETTAGRLTLRFPSYQKGLQLVELLSVFGAGDGLARVASLLDFCGLAVGVCWWHPELDLEAGEAPPIPRPDPTVPPGPGGELGELHFGGRDAPWREYGEAVVDELQERGATLADLVELVNAIASKAAASLDEIRQSKATAGN